MKSDKGSITVYVLIAMLFFVAILVGLYVSNVNYERTVKDVKEYKTNNIDDIYYDITDGDVYNPTDQIFFFQGDKRPFKDSDGKYYWKNKNDERDNLYLDGYTDDMYNSEEKCIDFNGNAQGTVNLKVNNLPNKNYTIIMVIQDTTDGNQYYYSNKTSANNGFSFVKENNKFRAYTSKNYAETEATKEKIQIANVYDVEKGTLTMYKNGEIVATGSIEKSLVANNSTLRIANDFSSKQGNSSFKCYDFMFYNRVLEATEINQIYKANQRKYGI